MQVISVTDSLYRSIIVRTAEKRWKLHDLSPHHRPSSVSQSDWASFTDPLWLDLQNRVSPAWGSAPVDVKLFPPHPPWWQEGKKPLSRPEPTHSTEGRKSGGAEKGEAVNGRLSWWRGRAVYAWDLPICSFYFHNSISLSHFLFFYLHFYHRGPDISYSAILPIIRLPVCWALSVTSYITPHLQAGNLFPSEPDSA